MEFEFFGRRFDFFTNRGQFDKAAALLKQYFLSPAVIASTAIFIIWAALYIYSRKMKKTALRERLRLLAPLAYLAVIISLSVLNRPFGTTGSFHFKFDFVFAGNGMLHETRIVMAAFNFMYYIPYGVLLSWSRTLKNDWLSLLAVVITGFAAEALQSILGAGVGSVEHVLMYTLGGLCGIGIYKLAARRKKDGGIKK